MKQRIMNRINHVLFVLSDVFDTYKAARRNSTYGSCSCGWFGENFDAHLLEMRAEVNHYEM